MREALSKVTVAMADQSLHRQVRAGRSVVKSAKSVLDDTGSEGGILRRPRSSCHTGVDRPHPGVTNATSATGPSRAHPTTRLVPSRNRTSRRPAYSLTVE